MICDHIWADRFLSSEPVFYRLLRISLPTEIAEQTVPPALHSTALHRANALRIAVPAVDRTGHAERDQANAQ